MGFHSYFLRTCLVYHCIVSSFSHSCYYFCSSYSSLDHTTDYSHPCHCLDLHSHYSQNTASTNSIDLSKFSCLSFSCQALYAHIICIQSSFCQEFILICLLCRQRKVYEKFLFQGPCILEFPL
jgi:hypothetical protein